MKEYSIEIGTWESGTIHRLFAEGPEDAFAKAKKFFVGTPGIKGTVVQITEVSRQDGRRRTVFDYMNGFEIYKG